MPRISDFPIKSNPSASATLSGVDVNENGEKENIQIPITEFVTRDENGNVKIRNGAKVTFYNKDESGYCVLECEENGVLSLNGNTVATLDDIPSGDGTPSGSSNSMPYISFGCYSPEFTVADLMRELPSEVISSGQPAIVSFVGMLSGTFLCRFNNYHSDYYGCEFTDLTNLKACYFEGTSSSLSLYDNLSNGASSGGGSAINLDHSIPVTYAELRDLRYNSSLVPGMFYRITDYECTTAQENTRATDHRFDIIIQAISNDRLSETAKADYNSEDSYFSDNNANLSAWEIKYCLDNDVTRFAWCGQCITNIQSGFSQLGDVLVRCPDFDWASGLDEYVYAWGTEADAEDGDINNFIYSKSPTLQNGEEVWHGPSETTLTVVVESPGKGVIYYMRDEHGNECSYDFKNIQFKRYVSYDNEDFLSLVMEGDEEFWAYTFCGTAVDSDGNQTDGLDGSTVGYWGIPNIYDQQPFHNNVIKPQWYDDNLCENNKLRLNNIVLQGVWHNTDVGIEYSECSYDNVFEEDCYNITLGRGCWNNHFAIWNYEITLDSWCSFNKFETCCFGIHLGDNVSSCYFGDGCCEIHIDTYCHNIRLGKYSCIISFGVESYEITIGESNSEIHLNCYSNNITTGKGCSVISTGESISNITLGDGCYDIGFGEGNHHITFGRYGGETSIGDYSNWMTFGDGCQCNNFEGQCSNIVLGRDCYNNRFCDNTHIYLDDNCCDNAIEPYTERIHLRSFICNGDFGHSGPVEGLAIYTFQGIEERGVGED